MVKQKYFIDPKKNMLVDGIQKKKTKISHI